MLKAIGGLSAGILISCSVVAQPLTKEAGWEFTLSVHAGYSVGESQFDTDHDNQITNDLNNSGQSNSSVLVYPLGRIQYTLDSLKTQFYLGNSREQVSTAKFQYEFGVIHQFGEQSKLTVAVFPKISLFNETWKDPFATNTKRQITDQKIGGARIAVDNILGTGLTVQYAIASSSIDEELSGQSQLSDASEIALLKRDSLYQRVEVGRTFPISPGVLLKPAFQYTNRNANGDANSYDQYTGQLSLLLFKKRHSLITTINAGVRLYKRENPIFNDKQDLIHTGLFSIYSYQRPFDWQDWSWTAMFGYTQENSDISFYDNKGVIISTGMVYRF